MNAAVMSDRYHRLVLAFLPGVFVIWFAQVTIEKVQALLSGHQVIWAEKHLVLLSGWSFVVAAGVLTLLAIWSAYAIWRSQAIAWVLLAVLWSAPTLMGTIHILVQDHIDPLGVLYLLGFAAMGVMLAVGVRRLAAEARPNKSLERTRER